MLFNSDGNPLGGFNANIMLVLNASATIAILLLIFTRKKDKFYLSNNPFVIILIAYYTLGMISTVYSPLVLITAYNSVVGILYVLAACAISEYVKGVGNQEQQYQWFLSFVLKFCIASIFAHIVFYYLYFDQTDFLTKGIGADFTAALLLFVAISNATIKRNKISILYVMIASIIALRLNSFSSLLSVLVAYVIFLFYQRKYIQLLIVTSLFLVSLVGFLSFIELNQGSEILINNKPINAYLTGSGRFDYYREAFDVIANYDVFQWFFGNGFMAERVIMENRGLPWVTDPHNSFLMSTLGLGFLGAVLYVLFFSLPFLYSRVLFFKNEQSKELNKHWIFFHSVFLVYGCTSSYYLGRPTVIIIFAIVLSNLVYGRKNRL
ncbi:O-antigen ligase family protein [Photobacterium swingsii]|uniref:O-antigen ligase family protein n=1 Tax=Photobacterium swingsii TaxID=680026 RepID=UPI00406806A2